MLVCVATHGFAATNAATSCSDDHIQDAIDASTHGDTVTVPAGDCSWDEDVTLTNKRLNIIGAGRGVTILRQGVSGVQFEITNYHTNRVFIKGFTFHISTATTFGHLSFSSTQQSIPSRRYYVTECDFISSGSGTRRTVAFLGTYGLVWNCNFWMTNAASAALPELLLNSSTSLTNNWHGFGKHTDFLGSTNQLIMEDCKVWQDAVGEGTDFYYGGNMTVRHCTITNTALGDHGSDSGFRGAFVHEWYFNNFYDQGIAPWSMQMRGGTGVIYSNVVHWDGHIQFQLYRADTSPIVGDPPGQIHDGNFDQTYPGAGYPVGYPLLDQHGRGPFPTANFVNCASGCTTNNYETNAPIYLWGNTIDGDTTPTVSVISPNAGASLATNYVKLGRDYFENTVHPTYVPLAYPDPARAEFDGGGESPAASTVKSKLTGPARISAGAVLK